MDPMTDRFTSVRTAGTAVGDLLGKFAPSESRAAYAEWTEQPLTRLVAAAISEMALCGPMRAQEPLVQYGITLGLGIAAQLLRSPEALFPSMFSGASGVPGAQPPETYGTAPDQV